MVVSGIISLAMYEDGDGPVRLSMGDGGVDKMEAMKNIGRLL
jgi:hypothetical protein